MFVPKLSNIYLHIFTATVHKKILLYWRCTTR